MICYQLAKQFQNIHLRRENWTPSLFEFNNLVYKTKKIVECDAYRLLGQFLSYKQPLFKLSLSVRVRGAPPASARARARYCHWCAAWQTAAAAASLRHVERGCRRGGGESVWPASISAELVDSRGQAFGAVTACGWRLPWTARERMRIVDLVSTCRYSADEEDEQEGEEEEEEDGGKSFKKVSSDDGWAFNVCTTLFTPHSLYSY